MGRPNLTEQRTREILDAFERCVSRFGIEGSSLDRIAEEAGMKRSILRHYMGNRDALVLALADRVITKYEAGFDEYLKATARECGVDQLLGYLFPSTTQSTTESVMVIESLIALGASDGEIQEKMKGYIDRFVGRCAALLQGDFPSVPKSQCWAVAYGVVSICFNQESLVSLELPSKYAKAAKRTAQILIDSLG